MRNSEESHEKFMRRSSDSHEKFKRKSCESDEKIMRESWECHEKGIKTRRGSPLDCRPSPAEASPIGQIYPFSKMAVTFEPLMGFRCPSGFRKLLITMT